MRRTTTNTTERSGATIVETVRGYQVRGIDGVRYNRNGAMVDVCLREYDGGEYDRGLAERMVAERNATPHLDPIFHKRVEKVSEYTVTRGETVLAEGVTEAEAERVADLSQLAIDSGLVAMVATRRRLANTYIVPDTLDWADWSDASAVRYHGICTGSMTQLAIAVALLARAEGKETDYDTLFDLAKAGGLVDDEGGD